MSGSIEKLVEAAREAIRGCYREPEHTVVAAVRGASGAVYVGPNVWAKIHGSCAEPVAIGAAALAGERGIAQIVAVGGEQGEDILPPCGNCRQIILAYGPAAAVVLERSGRLESVSIHDLLPESPYRSE